MAIHIDHEFLGKDLEKAIDLITYNAAKAWHITDRYGIHEGNPANLLVFREKSILDITRPMEKTFIRYKGW